MMTNIATMRSFLFVPGDRPERFDKGCASGADCIILDLEDAVLPDAKPDARQAIATWLESGGTACVRINPDKTPWHQGDVDLLAHPNVTAVVLPKADPDSIDRLSAALPRELPILALIETANGLLGAVQVARAPLVERLLFGSFDFAVDTGIDGQGDELAYARSALVVASAAADLGGAVDGVSLVLDDSEALIADCRHAKRSGVAGKLCIHPKQVAAVNKGFSPDPAEVERARAIIAAAQASDRGAIQFEGKLIDKPVLDRAHRLVASVTL